MPKKTTKGTRNSKKTTSASAADVIDRALENLGSLIGRPPDAGVKRSALLQVRVTPAELKRYDEAAQRLDLDLSWWVRETLNALAK